MHPRFVSRPVFIAAGLGPVLWLAACASLQQTGREVADEPKRILTAAEYERVYVTGSNLPVLVPRSPTVRPLVNASPVTTLDAAEFTELVRRAQTPRR